MYSKFAKLETAEKERNKVKISWRENNLKCRILALLVKLVGEVAKHGGRNHRESFRHGNTFAIEIRRKNWESNSLADLLLLQSEHPRFFSLTKRKSRSANQKWRGFQGVPLACKCYWVGKLRIGSEKNVNWNWNWNLEFSLTFLG